MSKLARANKFLRRRIETLEAEVRDFKGQLVTAEEVAAPLAGGSPVRWGHGGNGGAAGGQHVSLPCRGSPSMVGSLQKPMEVDAEEHDRKAAVGLEMNGVDVAGSNLVARVDALIAAHETFRGDWPFWWGGVLAPRLSLRLKMWRRRRRAEGRG